MILRLALILMFIASVAAGGLALLNNQTAPVIAENKRLEQERARKEVVETLNVARFEEVTTEDGFTYYLAYDANGEHVGYAAVAYGKGYSSTIETVAGFDLDLNVTGLKVTFQQETPGLGTKVAESWFLERFTGKDATSVAVVQDRGSIDAVTGATISSRALSNSLNVLAKQIEQAPPVERTETASAADMDDEMDAMDDESSTSPGYADEEAGLGEFSDEEAE